MFQLLQNLPVEQQNIFFEQQRIFFEQQRMFFEQHQPAPLVSLIPEVIPLIPVVVEEVVPEVIEEVVPVVVEEVVPVVVESLYDMRLKKKVEEMDNTESREIYDDYLRNLIHREPGLIEQFPAELIKNIKANKGNIEHKTCFKKDAQGLYSNYNLGNIILKGGVQSGILIFDSTLSFLRKDWKHALEKLVFKPYWL